MEFIIPVAMIVGTIFVALLAAALMWQGLMFLWGAWEWWTRK